MKKQRNLFRWFIGGFALAGVAAAATSPPGSPSPPPLAIASAPNAQAVESAPAPGPVQAPKAAAKQSSKIWECTLNGVKTFTNNPCGQKSSLVTLRPINTMKPTPVIRSARANEAEPPYTKEYSDQNLYPDQNTSAPGFDDNSYAADQGYQGYAYAPISRPNHHLRSEHHHDSSSGPHKSGPKPHNPVPALQLTMPEPRSEPKR
jgi:hypothetical protein